MAAGMSRVTKEDLIELIQKELKDKEYAGYVFTWGDAQDVDSQHQVILLNRPLGRGI